jgi:hypothetical protein
MILTGGEDVVFIGRIFGHFIKAIRNSSPRSSSFHNPDLLLRQSVQLADQGVYLPVRGLDPALEGGLILGRAGIRRAVCGGRASDSPGQIILLILFMKQSEVHFSENIPKKLNS